MRYRSLVEKNVPTKTVHGSLVGMMCERSAGERIIVVKHVGIKHGAGMACAKHALTIHLLRISVDKHVPTMRPLYSLPEAQMI